MNALGFFDGIALMQMGQDNIHQPKEGTAEEESCGGRNPGNAVLVGGHFDGGGQQGPEAGGNHYAAGERRAWHREISG